MAKQVKLKIETTSGLLRRVNYGLYYLSIKPNPHRHFLFIPRTV